MQKHGVCCLNRGPRDRSGDHSQPLLSGTLLLPPSTLVFPSLSTLARCLSSGLSVTFIAF